MDKTKHPGFYKKPGSRYWHFEFEVAGERIRRSSRKTSLREAEAVRDEAREQAIQAAKVRQIVQAEIPSLRLDDAALRYWDEVEHELSSAADVHRELRRIVGYLGEHTLLTDITDETVDGLVKWRSKHRAMPHNAPKDRKPEDYPFLAPATVNRTTVRLQALFTHVKKWKDGEGKRFKFPDEPDWSEHLLPESKNPARAIKGTELAKHDGAIRDDYADFVEFALASSRRFAFCYSLEWTEVHWDEGVIKKNGKRKPDGSQKDETLPITPRIREILEGQLGHHPKYVFTYVARRNVPEWVKGKTYTHKETEKSFVAPWNQRPLIKGQRYPLTYNGAMTAYRRAMEGAGLNIGFHDLRRTRATEVYEANRDVRAVQKMMGHTQLATTERYLADNFDHIRDAMEKADQRREVPTVSPHSKRKKTA